MVQKKDPYSLKTPCPNCPFRTDVKPYLSPERVEEIRDGLERGEFPCHKTLDYDTDEEGGVETEKTAHCAGALILLEKEGTPSQMMRISERLGMYDARKLDMDAPVFDSWDDMIAAQPERRRRRRK